MSTKIGNATDYVDLINQLDEFLTATGHAWGKSFTGTGDGDLIEYLGTASSVAETFTLTATSSTSFSVVGSSSGAIGTATVGSTFSHSKITFKITAGSTAYVAGDVWKINTSPAWTRVARWGCADTRLWTTNLTEPQKLIDGSSNSVSVSTAAVSATYIEWEMVAPTAVRRLFARASDSNPSRMPTTFVLKYKDAAGDAWTTAQTFTKASWSTGEGAIFPTTSDPGAHKYWRLDMSVASGTTEIGELYLYRDLAGDVVSSARAEWVWMAPGLNGTQQIYTAARTDHDQAADIFNVGFIGFRSWDPTLRTIEQPGGAGVHRGMMAVASPISYWFVVNGQRAIVVTKLAGIYQIAYFGFGYPYEPPSVHAYPMIIAASWKNNLERYSSVDADFRFPIDPGRGTAAAYYPDSAWRNISNRTSAFGAGTTEGGIDSGVGYEGKVWPACYDNGYGNIGFLRENIDGSRFLMPCVIVNTNPRHAWGEFDGLFWTTGFGTTVEAIIRESRFDHLVVSNIFRTTNKHYGAVRLD